MIACKTLQEATDLIRYCLRSGGITIGRHFRAELANEGLTLADAYQVLNNGNVFMPPEKDIRSGEWKYRSEGRDPEGKKVAIVFCLRKTKEVS